MEGTEEGDYRQFKSNFNITKSNIKLQLTRTGIDFQDSVKYFDTMIDRKLFLRANIERLYTRRQHD